MENQDKEEKSRHQFINEERRAAIKDIEKDIHRFENDFAKNNAVQVFKRNLSKITTTIDSLNLFTGQEVLVQTASGWEAKIVPFLLLKTYPTSASDDFCLTPGGTLYKIEHQPLTIEDYKALREISPDAPGYLKWSNRVEVSYQEYKRFAPRIFQGLRFLINDI